MEYKDLSKNLNKGNNFKKKYEDLILEYNFKFKDNQEMKSLIDFQKDRISNNSEIIQYIKNIIL
jgi:hypothetical protein